jgi:hypothetical protein
MTARSIGDQRRKRVMIGPSWRPSRWFPQPLEIASRWVGDGAADLICDAIRDECTAPPA